MLPQVMPMRTGITGISGMSAGRSSPKPSLKLDIVPFFVMSPSGKMHTISPWRRSSRVYSSCAFSCLGLPDGIEIKPADRKSGRQNGALK